MRARRQLVRKSKSASSRAQSLHLNSNSPGSATCSCLSFLQLISGLLLFKIAFGKCFHGLLCTIPYAISLYWMNKEKIGCRGSEFTAVLVPQHLTLIQKRQQKQKQGCRRYHTIPGWCCGARSWWAQDGEGEHSCSACPVLPELYWCCSVVTGVGGPSWERGRVSGAWKRRFGLIHTKTQHLAGRQGNSTSTEHVCAMESLPGQYFYLLLFW